LGLKYRGVRGVQSGGEDHCADIFRCGRFEQVGSAACAVADVISDQVGDNSGIARIVFGNPRFNFSHKVRADIGSFGVNSTSELCKESDEACTETVPNDQEGDLRNIIRNAERLHEGKESGDAEKTHRNDKKSGYRSAA